MGEWANEDIRRGIRKGRRQRRYVVGGREERWRSEGEKIGEKW